MDNKELTAKWEGFREGLKEGREHSSPSKETLEKFEIIAEGMKVLAKAVKANSNSRWFNGVLAVLNLTFSVIIASILIYIVINLGSFVEVATIAALGQVELMETR